MKAEAEAMKEKAEAYKLYGDAAIIQMLADKLPEIARYIAEPLSRTDKMVVIDNGGQGGASKITKNVTNVMAELPDVINSLTGINIVDLIKDMTKKEKINKMAITKDDTPEVKEIKE